MTLQDWFYALAIAYFLTTWVVIIAVIVFLLTMYRRFQQLQGQLVRAAGRMPLSLVLFPIGKRVWQWWRRRKR